MVRRLVLIACAGGALAPALPRSADACGACFAPPATVTTVESHRMAVSLSPERSILWDQIRYSGDPRDFVWVLPVPSPEVTVEVAEPTFFDELESFTQPRVIPKSPPMQPCFGCCSSATPDSGYEPGDVVVYDTRIVGPYETVTIGSGDADALQNWLAENDYRVAESAVPTIMHYVDRGSVFVVLRLAPGEGVQAMQPVRITYPGYMASFPLEMVKIGAAGRLELTLWVLSEQRYEAWNYANAVVDPKEIAFDWDRISYDPASPSDPSNYNRVFRDTIDRAGGRAWVTEFAGVLDRGWFSARTDVDEVFHDIPTPYLTRLRTSMLLDYLDQDLVLVPAMDPSDVSRDLPAGEELHRPFGDEGDGCSLGEPRSHIALIAFLLLSTGFIFRPRKRRRAS